MKPLFHVYIDEAGDPGVKPKETDEPLWTDWFVLSAVVVSDARDAEIVDWVYDMGEAVRSRGTTGLHYRKLSDTNRERVCRMLARKPVRLFAVASHKDSMRNHRNAKLGKAKDQEFYNWCLRLLLERVTAWCHQRCQHDGVEVGPARIVFSERGGHDYAQLRAYLKKLEAQTLTGTLVLKARGLAPGIINNSLCEVRPHAGIAGLQLADITASAFLQAVSSVNNRHSLIPATTLRPRIAVPKKKAGPADFGLLRLPFPNQGEIPEEDREIFRTYGYRFKGDGPRPSVPMIGRSSSNG
jgi:hypothetical protein